MLFKRLIKSWQNWRKAKRLDRLISPAVFIEMSQELQELAGTVSKVRQGEPEFQARASRIRREMEQLGKLAAKPEFMRLTKDKRLELRKSLLISKAQLLQSMHTVEPPTATIQ